jgi:hypothetical protein
MPERERHPLRTDGESTSVHRRLRYAAEPLADVRVEADFVPRPGELPRVDGLALAEGLPLRRREQLRKVVVHRQVRAPAGRR